MDLTIRAGAMARLECAALGHPAPQIAWQKDGGTDFPAARERRMHVMPEDDVFFIVDVKIEDIGVYSCTAQNSAGSISANATLTVLGEWMLSDSVILLVFRMPAHPKALRSVSTLEGEGRSIGQCPFLEATVASQKYSGNTSHLQTCGQ